MKYVILAGGSGTRLWPLSRKNFAKQFINLVDNRSMLQNTAVRVSKQNGSDVYVISNEESKFIINDQIQEILPDFNEKNMIIEPEGRNTAPAIAYGALHFDSNDIMVILSSDHHIEDAEKFNTILNDAAVIAEKGYIVTLGIIPDSPKTGYGYIKKSDKQIDAGFVVERFVEKPTEDLAKEYLSNGNYLWNAGIFVFKVSVFFEEIKKHSKDIFDVMEYLKLKINNLEAITLDDYRKFNKISIDYALMEKSQKIAVIPSKFGWSDVGNFKSLYDILPQDNYNNALRIDKNNFFNHNSKNLMVFGNKRKIAALNLKDLIIVDTPDALLVADSSEAEQVKKIVDELQEKKERVAIFHTTVYRPWGSFKTLDIGPNYQVKQLVIRPGKRISLQYHHHRSEHWTVVSGIAEITKGSKLVVLKPSQSTYIPSTVHHRLYNPSQVKDLIVIEIQTGDYLGEDDIIRIEDDFKRN